MLANNDYHEGLEVGAVSVKWVRRTNGKVVTEIVRHEGRLKEKIQDIFNRHDGSIGYFRLAIFFRSRMS